MRTLNALLKDEAGFIVSAELVLVATILVIGMVVGLSSIQHAVVSELNDIGDALGSLNQGYVFGGFTALKSNNAAGGVKARTYGSVFVDVADDCDNATDRMTKTVDSWRSWLRDVAAKRIQLVSASGDAAPPSGGTRSGQALSFYNWDRFGGRC